jgi:hypothetical protein
MVISTCQSQEKPTFCTGFWDGLFVPSEQAVKPRSQYRSVKDSLKYNKSLSNVFFFNIDAGQFVNLLNVSMEARLFRINKFRMSIRAGTGSGPGPELYAGFNFTWINSVLMPELGVYNQLRSDYYLGDLYLGLGVCFGFRHEFYKGVFIRYGVSGLTGLDLYEIPTPLMIYAGVGRAIRFNR